MTLKLTDAFNSVGAVCDSWRRLFLCLTISHSSLFGFFVVLSWSGLSWGSLGRFIDGFLDETPDESLVITVAANKNVKGSDRKRVNTVN